ncbi:hypothetical protein [Comamonas sp. NLF-1-9]|uniref:hypothetical protein n=1 Tax=Comamonas sp. NLF-1-9 TaxID=2853163 RepID=UPI001C481DA5|nr:hypothetical protein [Comamonas sp. NLF-1-9]QXL83780.1 hypothetical protein KUD94_11075 [Comamonas sp. NLF-1-9]
MPAPRSRWTSLRLQRRALEQDLRRRHSLRLHGWLIGALTLALTWGSSALLRQAGVHSLALRYLLALAAGYGAYLLVLRCWALWLLRPGKHHRMRVGDALDAAEIGADAAQALRPLLPEAAGGEAPVGDAAQGAAQLGEALGLAGAVVVVPVLALFALLAALLLGAGSFALLFFGWDVLLAVALELAFAGVAARTAIGLERSGWLGAALRLTRRPMLLLLLCAVALGAAVDHWLPQAHSLPEALRALRLAPPG